MQSQWGKRLRALAAAMAAVGMLGKTDAGSALPVPAALAETVTMPEVLAAVSAEPAELAAPGEITLTFTVTNASDNELRNVTMTSADGMMTRNIGALLPDETQSVSLTHTVSELELSGGRIYYVVTCETDGGLFSYPVDTAIGKNVPQPEVEFLRQISSGYAAEGGTVTLVYTVRNAGNIPVYALRLTDEPGAFLAELEALEVGESRVFVNRAVLAEDAVSAPVLEYSTGAELENAYTMRLDESVIQTAYGFLDVSLSAAQALLDENRAEVSLTLTNGGTMPYLDLTVYDDVYGGIIADSIDLPAGSEPVVISHSYPLRGSGSYRWRIVGRTAAGEAIDLITETLELHAETPVSEPSLTLSAATALTRISRSGYVPFSLTLTNSGEIPATHVRVYEETRGDIRELAIVAAGEPTTFDIRYEVRGDTQFVFCASYTDDQGVEHVLSTSPIEVVIAAGGQKPESFEEASPMLGGLSVQIGNSSLFMVLLISSVIVLVVLSVVLLITSRRARKARKERAAARKQRLKEELGKTNRFKPVKRSTPKK